MLREVWSEARGFGHRLGGPALEGSLDDQVFGVATVHVEAALAGLGVADVGPAGQALLTPAAEEQNSGLKRLVKWEE